MPRKKAPRPIPDWVTDAALQERERIRNRSPTRTEAELIEGVTTGKKKPTPPDTDYNIGG